MVLQWCAHIFRSPKRIHRIRGVIALLLLTKKNHFHISTLKSLSCVLVCVCVCRTHYSLWLCVSVVLYLFGKVSVECWAESISSWFVFCLGFKESMAMQCNARCAHITHGALCIKNRPTTQQHSSSSSSSIWINTGISYNAFAFAFACWMLLCYDGFNTHCCCAVLSLSLSTHLHLILRYRINCVLFRSFCCSFCVCFFSLFTFLFIRFVVAICSVSFQLR